MYNNTPTSTYVFMHVTMLVSAHVRPVFANNFRTD
jgi:hypothetical protein